MNMDTFRDNWSSVNDRLDEKWPNLTEDDKERIERDGDELAPVLVERCHMTTDVAKREAKQFFESCSNLRGTAGAPERKASNTPSGQRGSSAPSSSSQGPQRSQSGSSGGSSASGKSSQGDRSDRGRSEGGRESHGGGQR
jgi:hypothetical protein